MSTLRFAPVNAEGLIADLDPPPAAYRVLLKLRSLSEPGGRIEIDQATIARWLDLSRPSVTAALRALDLAKLVKKQRNGVYQINPMLCGYTSPEDSVAAISTMDRSDRLTPASSIATAVTSPPTRTNSHSNVRGRPQGARLVPDQPARIATRGQLTACSG
ncbi:MarR family transcriptional regulator [Streptomyces sp. PA03-5A]|nr:MarR family transcriptional regulator [Streptomyces sp. PA03-5A]